MRTNSKVQRAARGFVAVVVVVQEEQPAGAGCAVGGKSVFSFGMKSETNRYMRPSIREAAEFVLQAELVELGMKVQTAPYWRLRRRRSGVIL